MKVARRFGLAHRVLFPVLVDAYDERLAESETGRATRQQVGDPSPPVSVTQFACMVGDTKHDQLALVTVDGSGRLWIEVQSVNGTVLHTLQVTPRD